jgi:hypothetical protein
MEAANCLASNRFKFPIEDYNRLVDAMKKADLALIDVAAKALEQR